MTARRPMPPDHVAVRRVLAILAVRPHLTVIELAVELDASEATIVRALSTMRAEGIADPRVEYWRRASRARPGRPVTGVRHAV